MTTSHGRPNTHRKDKMLQRSFISPPCKRCNKRLKMPKHAYTSGKLKFGLVCHECITEAEQDQLLRDIFNTVSIS